MTKTQNKPFVRLAAFALLGAMLFGLAAPRAFAAGQEQSYTATLYSNSYDYGDGATSNFTQQEVVSYQVGGREATLRVLSISVDVDPAEHEDPYTTIIEDIYTYSFSKPITSATRQGDWGIVFDVPAGTTVTCSCVGVTRSNAPFGEEYSEFTDPAVKLAWDVTRRVYAPEELYGWDALDNTRLGSGDGTVLTVAKGSIYQLWQWTEAGDAYKAPGGVIFRGV